MRHYRAQKETKIAMNIYKIFLSAWIIFLAAGISNSANSQSIYLSCDTVGNQGLLTGFGFYMSFNERMRTISFHYGSEPEILSDATINEDSIFVSATPRRMGVSMYSQFDDTADFRLSRVHGSADIRIWAPATSSEISACEEPYRRLGHEPPANCRGPTTLRRTISFQCRRSQRQF